MAWQYVIYVFIFSFTLLFHLSISFLSNYPIYIAMNKISRHTLLISLYQESEYFKTLTRELFKQSLVNLSSKETQVIWLYVHYFKICVCFSLLPNHHAIQPGANDMDTDWYIHHWEHLKVKCIVLHEYKREEIEHILRQQIHDILILNILDWTTKDNTGERRSRTEKASTYFSVDLTACESTRLFQNQRNPIPIKAAINVQSENIDKDWIQQDWLACLLVGRIPKEHSILRIFYTLSGYCKYEILCL